MKQIKNFILITTFIFSSFIFASADGQREGVSKDTGDASTGEESNKVIVNVEFMGSGVIALSSFEIKRNDTLATLKERLDTNIQELASLEKRSPRTTQDFSGIPEAILKILREKNITELPLKVDRLFLGQGGDDLTDENISSIKNGITLVFSSKRSFGDVLQGAHFLGAHLQGANFEGANLKGADFSFAYLEEANLKGANLKEADFYKAYLRKTHLEGAHLQGAHLERAHLEGAHLEGAHLEGAHLIIANLIRANFTGANLYKADLGWANITGANFTGANLIRANLEGVDLYKANFEEANLRWANLTCANCCNIL